MFVTHWKVKTEMVANLSSFLLVLNKIIVSAHNVSDFLDIGVVMSLNLKSLCLWVSAGIPMTEMVANLSSFFLVLTKIIVYGHNMSYFLDIGVVMALNLKSFRLWSGIQMTEMVANLSLFFLALTEIIVSAHNMSDLLDIGVVMALNLKSFRLWVSGIQMTEMVANYHLFFFFKYHGFVTYHV